MKEPLRGEVWIVDLGFTAKVRPCLVISAPIFDADRALVTIAPHTTSNLGTRFEVETELKFLARGAFDIQNVNTFPLAKFQRRLGRVPEPLMATIDTLLRERLGL